MKVEFCRFLGSMGQDGSIKLKPIGRAKNKIKKPTLPGWKNVVSEIVINKKFAQGLTGLEKYSHLSVVYFLNQEKECHLKHHPQNRKDVPYVGIFACRCPQRPNRLAFSTVKLLSRRGNVLKVKGLDILDKTPILDLKPYTPQYDAVKKPRLPAWVGRLVF